MVSSRWLWEVLSCRCLWIDLDEFVLLSGAARDAAFMVTEREIRRLQALQAGRVRFTETSCGFIDDAFHSVTSWVQAVTNGSSGFGVVSGWVCPLVRVDAEVARRCDRWCGG